MYEDQPNGVIYSMATIDPRYILPISRLFAFFVENGIIVYLLQTTLPESQGTRQMKTYPAIAVTLLAVLLFSSGGLLMTHATTLTPSDNDNSQALSLSLSGGVVDAGSQVYKIQQNGPIVAASVAGYSLGPSQLSTLSYSLEATVQGVSASGSATFHLDGKIALSGARLDMSGTALIVGMVPAVCLPSGISTGTCDSTDTSAVPLFFVGIATVQVTVTAPTGKSTVQTMQLPMLFESAYFNPFGHSIVFGSADSFSTLLVVTCYKQASIDWSNVVVEGQLGGVLGQTPVSGYFSEVSSEQEDLVKGTAQDSGSMTFSNVVDNNGNSVNALDVTGTYGGTSTIPLAGSYDCSTSLGFPAGSICTETGFQSSGSFDLQGERSTVMGSYSTTWGVPAFSFAGTALATVTS